MVLISWKPKRNSDKSIHQQIFHYLEERIITGEWPAGYKLPPQRKLAEELNVNRSTIVNVFEDLKSYGLIEGQKGSATRVTTNINTFLTNGNRVNWDFRIKNAIYKESPPFLKTINNLELDSNFIQLSRAELAAELFPKYQMREITRLVGENLNYLGYEDQKGYLPLRESIAKHLKNYGIDTSPDCILVTSGATQGLQLIALGLLEEGSTVFLGTPSYLYSGYNFQSVGIQLRGVAMDEEGMIPFKICNTRKYKNRDAIYSIPSFHNPTGIVMPHSRRNSILEMCLIQGLPLIEDDVYRDLWIDEPPPPPMKSMEGGNSVLYVGSLSKSLSPGLRIGWIVANKPVIERLADIKMQLDHGASIFPQHIAHEWLKGQLYNEYLMEIRKKLRVRRDFLLYMLEKHLGDIASWKVPIGGLFIWVNLNKYNSVRHLYLRLLNRGILIHPGSIYNEDRHSYVRLSFSYASMEELEEGIVVLAEELLKL
ncbi:PLP-dependent aminotransferase family protein [Bacillus pfraonensis]|uniref:aminotransferase-like domain-containing protein n=1 Tax=Bacillus TaxID=1386 RepID=UPI002A5804AE|nr:PLP-dependent aminotransferase family protein [Bacillus pseudomycoides]